VISIGYIVGTSVAGILALVCLLAIVGGVYVWRTDDFMEASVPFIGGIVGLVIVAGFYTFAAFPPFDMDYHRYDPKSGTVASIDKRLVSDGDSGMSEKYVVRFKDQAQQYACLDTRCADVKKGDQLELACVKVWQFYGTPGFDCEFVGTDKKG
jgi:hypothetical protein